MSDRGLQLTLRNYRAFDDSKPVHWVLDDGFRAFVGINNAGKSSLLRFFHEARPALSVLAQLHTHPPLNTVLGSPYAFPFQSVADQQEVFCNRNTRDMSAEFALTDAH